MTSQPFKSVGVYNMAAHTQSDLAVTGRIPASQGQVANATDTLFQHVLLHQMVEASADVCSDQTAIDYGGVHVTYGELESRANQLARYLLTCGVRRAQRVGILLERSTALYISILAVLKCGATCIPLDSRCPPDQIEYIFDDCSIRHVVTAAALRSRCPLTSTPIVLDANAEHIHLQSSARLDAAETGSEPTDVCLILYTSEATEQPKGVQIEHRSICHWVRAAQTIYQIAPMDRIYQGFSVSLVNSLGEIWMAWANGATLVAATPDIARAGLDLPAWLTAARVTVLFGVPALLSKFDADLPTVRLLILGGEVCPQSLIERWRRPGCRVLNTYGPTETTVTATYAECRAGQPVSIGQPLPGYHLYILDEQQRPVANGQPGELYIGGIGVARGYVNRDDLTRERFLANPFEEDRVAVPRLYRTGDVVQVNAAGEFEFLGRADSQVTIRGRRLELPEIEARLL